MKVGAKTPNYGVQVVGSVCQLGHVIQKNLDAIPKFFTAANWNMRAITDQGHYLRKNHGHGPVA